MANNRVANVQALPCFLPPDAMQSAVLAVTLCPSVRPSVRLFVTSRSYSTKTAERIELGFWHVSSRSGEAGLTANCYIRILK